MQGAPQTREKKEPPRKTPSQPGAARPRTGSFRLAHDPDFHEALRARRQARRAAEKERPPSRRPFFVLAGMAGLVALLALLLVVMREPPDRRKVISDHLREAGVPYTVRYVRAEDDVSLRLYSVNTPDLAPLQHLPIEALRLLHPHTADIEPLRGLPLVCLILTDTQVSDLSALEGMPLRYLDLRGTPVSDLQPLADMPLRHIGFSEETVARNVDVLRDMPSLRLINNYPPERYWEK